MSADEGAPAFVRELIFGTTTVARILLIDDDDDVRRVMCSLLHRHGHTVVEARDGVEGLKLYPSVKADLLITDIVMPGKSGLEVLAALRDRDPPVKAIAMSGGCRFGPGDSLHEAKSLGAVAVLAKPFSCGDLLAAVNESLAGGVS